jgi:hypothetical protein
MRKNYRSNSIKTIRNDAGKEMTSITTPFRMNFVHWSYAIFKVLYHGKF